MLSSTLLTVSRQQRNKQDSQNEIAYRTLKEKIITLEYAPATLLNEAQLMAELRLGRTPIREALQRLAFENLVVILPRRGTIVADLNISDIQKIFEIRVELEAQAAFLAARRATPTQIAEMESLLASADEIIQKGDHHLLIALDHQLHVQLARAAQNEFLEEILEQLYTHILRLWYVSLHEVGRLSESIKEHRDIISAIKVGDGEQAAEFMRAHIMSFQRNFNAVQ